MRLAARERGHRLDRRAVRAARTLEVLHRGGAPRGSRGAVGRGVVVGGRREQRQDGEAEGGRALGFKVKQLLRNAVAVTGAVSRVLGTLVAAALQAAPLVECLCSAALCV